MPGEPSQLTIAIKRLMDICGSLVGLIVLSPVFLVVSVLVRQKVGSPAFYRQFRGGKDGRPFRVWKFRSMTNARDASGQLLPDRERLTKFGVFLRSYSLDELPNLINILVGDMSLVGPRPLVARYVPRYNDRQRLRLRVKPGLTGLAQLNGRNSLDWETRLELDATYVERLSLLFDVKLLLLTLWKVVRKDGVLVSAGSDMEEFWGIQPKPLDAPAASGAEEDLSHPVRKDPTPAAPLGARGGHRPNTSGC